MMDVKVTHFADFFRELHSTNDWRAEPYPWQCRLAERAARGDWPGAVDLPTGSGKTACIDIAVFALACQASLPVEERTAPRRIVFCVNRRVIVDEAYQRSHKIAEALWRAERENDSEKPTLVAVAKCLRMFAGDSESIADVPPLDALELRGGIYRDNRWARSAVQPTIICSTIDQIGSRLLFRGYGVSSGAAPIQAALLAYDSLILLDEAHISQPFLQTVQWTQRYLDPKRWAREKFGPKPMLFVPMTATPTTEMMNRGVIALQEDDRSAKYPLLARLKASKPTLLTPEKDIVPAAVKAAKDVLSGEPKAIGIIVNRVASARTIYAELRKLTNRNIELAVELVIGSMRPVDRDKQQDRLREAIGPERPRKTKSSSITISTQCLEVGADYDFDFLITECASLDALRQRFGRLNRAGRDIDAEGLILIDEKQVQEDAKLDDTKPVDPIYGNALSRTWNWLSEAAQEGRVDFGLDAFVELLSDRGENGRPPRDLLSPAASLNSPVMMPAYVDLWSQTSPRPEIDPDVSLFIHGPQEAMRDVRICWRIDLGSKESNDAWIDIVSMLPPTSAECMSVPISRFRKWILNESETGETQSDMLAAQENITLQKKGKGKQQETLRSPFIIWRGNEKSVDADSVEKLRRLRPGDTLVLPVSAGGWSDLGHVVGDEEDFEVDIAEDAWRESKDREVIRLCSATRKSCPQTESIDELFVAASETVEPFTTDQWRGLLKRISVEVSESHPTLSKRFARLAKQKFGLVVERYPGGHGVVLLSRRRLGSHLWFLPPLDEGNDEQSHISGQRELSLNKHTQDVVSFTKRSCELLLPEKLLEAFELASELHDLGKADERFQAMLRRMSCTDAWLYWQNDDSLLAKSEGKPLSRRDADVARIRAGLPKGFRHELLSLQVAQQCERLPADDLRRDLVLHLVGSHHAHCRPLAPVIDDPNPPDVQVRNLCISGEDRQANSLHGFDSGIPERFWRLTRHFGWWGLAYLESVLRLADQQASALAESRAKTKPEPMVTAEGHA